MIFETAITPFQRRDIYYYEYPISCPFPSPNRNMGEDQGRRNLRIPNDNELFTVIAEHNGGNHARIHHEDGKNRVGRIPGRMKYRVWINRGDVMLVEPWDWQDKEANIGWRYTGEGAGQLRHEGHIQQSFSPKGEFISPDDQRRLYDSLGVSLQRYSLRADQPEQRT